MIHPSLEHDDSPELVQRALQGALGPGSLVLRYQPVFGSLGGSVVALEVLARWQGSNGLLAPKDFLPRVSQAGLAYPFDAAVVDRACAEVGLLRDAGLADVPLSVNLFPETLLQPDIAQRMRAVLDSHSCDASALAFEVEAHAQVGSGLLANDDDQLARLADQGFALCLDHLGAPCTSFGPLRSSRVLWAKVWARDACATDRARGLYAGLLSAAKSAGINLCAVGAQDPDTVDFLKTSGYGFVQGNALCEPLSAGELARRLRAGAFSCVTDDDRRFFGPIDAAIDLQQGEVRGPTAETGLVERKTPVFLISLEDGVFTTLYENDYVRHEERAFGRSTFADLDAEMNNPHALLRHVLLAKLGSLREVGAMATYNAETDQVRVRMTAQLVSAWGGRRAFLIVGSDLVDQVGEGGDPTAKDYWDRLRVLRRDDPITGLASIGALQDELARVAKSGPEAARWDLVCFNIRHFSVYNQRNGFVKGNALLRELGSVISEAAQTDRVARYFSDHFYALVARDRTEQAVDCIHRRMLDRGGFSAFVQAGACAVGDDPSQVDRGIDRAKMAVDAIGSTLDEYFCRFQPEMEERLVRANYLSAHLNEALKRGWVKLYLQPIVSADAGAPTGFEALARWDDPTYGFLPPSEFIPVLEDAHLIYRLDMYMIDRACALLAQRRSAGRVVLPVAVNLSQSDFLHASLHADIDTLLARYDIPHDLVRIEITETALLSDIDQMRAHIDRFHADGYLVCMDDFGSGYSSLAALHRFSFDVIKIDLSFLQDESEKTSVVLEEVVRLADRVGAVSLAEGVEHASQAAFLDSVGCQLLQGYLFSRPVPADDAVKLLEDGTKG